MGMIIRPETSKDYPGVAELQALAFMRPDYVGEIHLVAAQRQGWRYDPELSLVAEIEGIIAGQAFFYPRTLMVGGEALSAVSLAPLAVLPRFQNQGIGRQLMETGHRLARSKGYAFSFLVGHPEYYPRLGYQTRMYGTCAIRINLNDISTQGALLEERQVLPEDIPTLLKFWRIWHGRSDLALVPGNSILEWITLCAPVRTAVFTEEGQVVGYLRYRPGQEESPLLVLARDPHSLGRMLGELRSRITRPEAAFLQLPLSPASPVAYGWFPFSISPVVEPWDAAMVKILDESCKPIRDYIEQVKTGQRQIGCLIFPTEFEIA